jgi:putative chitinase
MILTANTLSEAALIPLSRAKRWVNHINNYLPAYGINTVNEVSSFLAQVGHESLGFKYLEENLNYSPEGLANTWPSRYRSADYRPNHLAKQLGRTQEKRANKQAIANITYANRMGNGSPESGDGYKYRGRGLIMLTGKNNYIRFSRHARLDLTIKPDLLLSPDVAVRSACWFWQENGLDKVDDDLSQMAETRIINGGQIGVRDRERRFSVAHSVLSKLNDATNTAF